MLSFLHRLAFPLTLSICTMPMLAAAQQAQSIGQLFATDASVKGSVMLAGSGTSVLSGSSIEAGTQAATLKLDRGGSLLVCEGTKLSIASSQSGRQMLFSLNSGNLELNYPLGTEADNLLTPDLRLLLPGPGTVHVAVRVAPNGDTCVQSLPWNAAAIVISETMGDATYQVKPDEAVVFKGGHLVQASKSKSNCGCPKETPPTQVAKATPPPAAIAPPSQSNSEPPAAAMLPPPQQPLSPRSTAVGVRASAAGTTSSGGRSYDLPRRRSLARPSTECRDAAPGEHEDHSTGADGAAALGKETQARSIAGSAKSIQFAKRIARLLQQTGRILRVDISLEARVCAFGSSLLVLGF